MLGIDMVSSSNLLAGADDVGGVLYLFVLSRTRRVQRICLVSRSRPDQACTNTVPTGRVGGVNYIFQEFLTAVASTWIKIS